jgi:predicted permease
MDRLLTDLRYAIRLLVLSPGWTAVAIVSLALGIGANAVVFSLVDAVLLDPFPYRESNRLVFLWGSRAENVTRGLSGADLADWQTENRTFTELDAFLGRSEVSLGPAESDRIKSACIGPRVLPMLGVEPMLGRNFTADEARFGGPRAVILSYALWNARFAADRSIIGRPIRMGDQIYDVVGVMPAGFFFPDTDAQLWTAAPCGFAGFEQRSAMLLHAVGRLRDGVSVAAAQADLDRINLQLARAYPETNANKTVGVFPLRHIVIGKYERALWTLVAAIGLVLLIACTNVVHLQLARGVDRETELAIRSASGAGRARLVRQLLTESSLLVAISACLAIFIAWIGIRAIHAFALTDIPRMEYARIDGRVVGFLLLISVLTALLSGLWPAWKASRIQASETLKLGATTTSGKARSQMRDLLAILEIAAAVTLLVASGLVVKSFVQISRAEWGFNPANVLLVDVPIPVPKRRDDSYQAALVESIHRRLADLNGVERFSVSANAPIRWNSWRPGSFLDIDGRRANVDHEVWVVGRHYFSTVGIPIEEGREFNDGDDRLAPRRVVISHTLAQRLWPGQSAVGKTLQFIVQKLVNGKPSPEFQARLKRLDRTVLTDPAFWEVENGLTWEVIGVAKDVKMWGLDPGGHSQVYIEMRQRSSTSMLGRSALKILVRTTSEPSEITAAVKARVASASPDVTFNEIVSMASLVAQSIGGRGSNKLLFIVASVFGTLALAFATIGIYGVVAHNVTQRLREIGIRVALGAARRDVVRIVIGYGLRLLVSGLALGVTIAWAATRGMGSLLFATRPLDGFTYAAAIAVLAVAAIGACGLPLRRALQFDPVILFKA